MIYFLETINECTQQDMAMVMKIVKNILNIIHIVAPILLIISLAIYLTQLVMNPDNKKLLPTIRNSFIAAIILFFIPTIVDAGMAMISNDYTISACWNETKEENYKLSSYIPTNDDEDNKKNIIGNSDEYQKGTPQNNNDNNNNTSSNNNINNNQNSNVLSTKPGLVSGDVEVHFINPNSRVDAIYIKSGEQSIFIDGGFKGDSKSEIAYLERLGVKHIDYYIGTHSHKDHVEAAPPIIQKYSVNKVLVGRETCTGSGSTYCTWYAIRGFASDQKISLDGVSTTALKQNYNSLVLRLDYGSTSFMLTGDNSAASTIKKINENYPGLLNVDVLKNAHHNGCTSDSIYQMYNAEYVVFTTRHDYLPSNACINTIKKYGAKNYYIVANGHSESVLFTSDGTNIKVYDHYN